MDFVNVLKRINGNVVKLASKQVWVVVGNEISFQKSGPNFFKLPKKKKKFLSYPNHFSSLSLLVRQEAVC